MVNDFGETCTQPFGFSTDDPAAVEDANQDLTGSYMEMYPNPAKDIVNIASDQAIINVTLHSMAGAMVMQLAGSQASTMQIDVTNLPAGVYLATIATENKATTLKLIVEK